MPTLHACIVEVLKEEFPRVADAWYAELATRILAAVANHPEKAEGEGRADCHLCRFARQRADSPGPDQHYFCQGCGKRFERRVEHPDTIALRELTTLVEEEFGGYFDVGDTHGSVLLRVRRRLDDLESAAANRPSPPRQTIRDANGLDEPPSLSASVELRMRNKCHTTATARAHARIDALIEEIEERLAEMRGGR